LPRLAWIVTGRRARGHPDLAADPAGPIPSPFTERFAMHSVRSLPRCAESGEVRVLRLLGVFDPGRIIQPPSSLAGVPRVDETDEPVGRSCTDLTTQTAGLVATESRVPQQRSIAARRIRNVVTFTPVVDPRSSGRSPSVATATMGGIRERSKWLPPRAPRLMRTCAKVTSTRASAARSARAQARAGPRSTAIHRS
jgi:hypothetical protein